MKTFTVRLTATASLWKDVEVQASSFEAAKDKVEEDAQEAARNGETVGWEFTEGGDGAVYDVTADEEPV